MATNCTAWSGYGFGISAAAMGAPQQLPPAPGPQPVPAPSTEPDPPPPPRRAGGFWAVLALLAGVGAGVWLYQSPLSTPDLTGGGGGGTGLFRTVDASTGELRETLRVGGSIRAEEYAAIRAPRIQTGSRGGGGGASMTLIEMAAAGTVVNKGDVIAQFDRVNQQEQIDDREAGVVQAQALVKVREANLMIELETKRQEELAAEAELDKATLDLRTAPVRSKIEAEVLENAKQEAEATFQQLEQEVALLGKAHAAALRQAQIDLEQERVDLARAELNAGEMLLKTPIDGIVVHETMFRGGSFAQVANGDEVRSGTLFMQIVNPRSMVLEGQVNQADSQNVRVGQVAHVQLDAYPNEVFEGRVRSVSAMAGGGSDGRSRSGSGDYVRMISVTIDILDHDARIIPDLSASADIVLQSHENVVMAPREALDRFGEQVFVWVRTGLGVNEVERRAVEVGALNDTHAVVTSGLSGGEKLEIRMEDRASLR